MIVILWCGRWPRDETPCSRGVAPVAAIAAPCSPFAFRRRLAVPTTRPLPATSGAHRLWRRPIHGGPIVLVLRGKLSGPLRWSLSIHVGRSISEPVVATCAACRRASGCGGTVVVLTAQWAGPCAALTVFRIALLPTIHCRVRDRTGRHIVADHLQYHASLALIAISAAAIVFAIRRFRPQSTALLQPAGSRCSRRWCRRGRAANARLS